MIIYKKEITDLGNEVILRYNENNTISYIPVNAANSDYQAYLKSLEAEQSTPIPTE